MRLTTVERQRIIKDRLVELGNCMNNCRIDFNKEGNEAALMGSIRDLESKIRYFLQDLPDVTEKK